MTLKERLDAIVARHNLLNHPFYRAWSAGTLPVDALKTYAREYGQLVRLMPAGWNTLGDEETVEEEKEHAELWDDFSRSLKTEVGNRPELQETGELIGTVSRLFLKPLTAAGALYAFEVQQPATAQSKLDGLRMHFPDLDARLSEPYFEVHSHNHHESEKLIARMAGSSLLEEAEYESACDEMSTALWNALSGIYGKHCKSEAC